MGPQHVGHPKLRPYKVLLGDKDLLIKTYLFCLLCLGGACEGAIVTLENEGGTSP